MSATPLARRKYDLVFLAFFFLNLSFITYIVDLEQLVIADPHQYPAWPTATPRLGVVVLANAGWFLFPIAVMIRLWRERPFAAAAPQGST